MKIFFATIYISLSIALGSAQTSGQTALSNPNFTGIWIFNLSESKGPKSVDMSSNREVATEILHKDPEFRIITRNLATNAIESEFVYYTDGRIQTNKVRRTETSNSKWDGGKIVTKATDSIGDTKTEWSLSPDGNKLTEKIKSTTRISYMLNGKLQGVRVNTSEFKKVYDKDRTQLPTQR